MKIKFCSKETFENLFKGEAFLVSTNYGPNDLWMKIETIIDGDNFEFNAVRLENGEIGFFKPNEQVRHADVEIAFK